MRARETKKELFMSNSPNLPAPHIEPTKPLDLDLCRRIRTRQRNGQIAPSEVHWQAQVDGMDIEFFSSYLKKRALPTQQHRIGSRPPTPRNNTAPLLFRHLSPKSILLNFYQKREQNKNFWGFLDFDKKLFTKINFSSSNFWLRPFDKKLCYS